MRSHLVEADRLVRDMVAPAQGAGLVVPLAPQTWVAIHHLLGGDLDLAIAAVDAADGQGGASRQPRASLRWRSASECIVCADRGEPVDLAVLEAALSTGRSRTATSSQWSSPSSAWRCARHVARRPARGPRAASMSWRPFSSGVGRTLRHRVRPRWEGPTWPTRSAIGEAAARRLDARGTGDRCAGEPTAPGPRGAAPGGPRRGPRVGPAGRGGGGAVGPRDGAGERDRAGPDVQPRRARDRARRRGDGGTTSPWRWVPPRPTGLGRGSRSALLRRPSGSSRPRRLRSGTSGPTPSGPVDDGERRSDPQASSCGDGHGVGPRAPSGRRVGEPDAGRGAGR